MTEKRQKALVNAVNFALIGVIFIFRYSGLLVLRLGEATSIMLIPLIVAISIFFGEFSGFMAGLVSGILLDTQVVGSSCFNLFALMLLGLLSGLFSTYLLNKNLKSAICLCLGATFLYFLSRYLFLFAFMGSALNFDYFISYLIPSVIYTSIFIIPFYYLERLLRS